MYIFGINGAHLLITCFKVSEQNLDGVNKVAAEIQTNEELRNKIDIITKKINPS